MWSLPKGICERDESFLDTARRETAEETGLTDLVYVDDLGSYQRHPVEPDGSPKRDEIKEIHVFLFTYLGSDPLTCAEGERVEPQWVSIDKVAHMLTHEADKEFYASVIRYIYGCVPDVSGVL